MGLRRRSGISVDRLVDPLQVLEQDRLMISELRVLRLDLQRSLETLERFLVAPFRLERVPHLFEDSPAKHPRLVERSIQDQRVVQRIARLLEPPEMVEGFRLRHPRVVVVRVELEALADQFEAFLVTAERIERVPLRVQRVVKIGLDLKALVVILQGRFVATHLVHRVPDVVPRNLISRVHFERPLEIRNRLLVSTEVVECVSEVVPEDLVAAVQLDRLLVGRDGLLEPVDPVERVALVVPGLLVRWVDRERLLVAGERFLVDPEHEEGEALVVPRLLVVRVRGNRAVVRFDGLLVPFEGVQRVAESRPSVSVARILGRRGVVCVDGFVELVQLLEELTLPRPSDRVLRICPDEGFVDLQRGLGTPEPRQDERLVVQCIRIRRVNREGAVVGDERLLELPELGERVPEVVRGDLVPGVALQRSSVCLYRVLVAAESIERHAAIVPHDVVLVSERRRPIIRGEGLRELAGVAVRVPAEELRLATRQVRLQRAGLAAFEARARDRSGIYSYEQRKAGELDETQLSKFRANRTAWEFFQAQAPSYQKAAVWWVITAKAEQTKLKRLAQLIDDSEHRRWVPPLTRRAPKRG